VLLLPSVPLGFGRVTSAGLVSTRLLGMLLGTSTNCWLGLSRIGLLVQADCCNMPMCVTGIGDCPADGATRVSDMELLEAGLKEAAVASWGGKK